MDTDAAVFRRLQEHLDNSPVGFPRTNSGAEIELLASLFTPEEAEIATYLSTFKLESAKTIYRRLPVIGFGVHFSPNRPL